MQDIQGIHSISDVEVDHILAPTSGGPHHPCKPCCIPKQGRLNQCFYKFLNAEKIAYIAKANARKVQQFLTWLRVRYTPKVSLFEFTLGSSKPRNE